MALPTWSSGWRHKLLTLWTALALPLLYAAAQDARVEIRHADRLRILRIGNESVQIAAGHVRILHDSTLLEADSLVQWRRRRIIEGWGNVRIVAYDTIEIRADRVHYATAERAASVHGNVTVHTPTMHLETDAARIDLRHRTARFFRPYRFRHPQFQLDARRGILYLATARFEAADSVRIRMTDGEILTDSLSYSHSRRHVIFPDSGCLLSARTRLRFDRGRYSLRHRRGTFAGNLRALSNGWYASADSLSVNDSLRQTQWFGHVVWHDTAGSFTASADSASERNRFRQGRLLGRVAVHFIQDHDTIWLSAPRMQWRRNGARWHAAGGVHIIVDSMGIRSDSVWGDTLRGIWRFFPIIFRYDRLIGTADSAIWRTRDDIITLAGRIWIRQTTPRSDLSHQLQARRGRLLLRNKRLHSGRFYHDVEALYYLFDDSNRIAGYSHIRADSARIRFGAEHHLERLRFYPAPSLKVYPPPTASGLPALPFGRAGLPRPPIRPDRLFSPEILVILHRKGRRFSAVCPDQTKGVP